MPAQAHPLEPFFHHEVTAAFVGKLGLNDPEIANYIAKVLCSFSETDRLFLRQGLAGHTREELRDLMLASDPVNGSALSFDAERAMRKYIGDYALFVAGMLPEAIGEEQPRQPAHHRRADPRGQGKLLHREPVQRVRVQERGGDVRPAPRSVRALRSGAGAGAGRAGQTDGAGAAAGVIRSRSCVDSHGCCCLSAPFPPPRRRPRHPRSLHRRR